jgi:hypothetical protein
LIAHELAHVYQASNGTLKAVQNPDWISDQMRADFERDFGSNAESILAKLQHNESSVEKNADQIAIKWGFNPPAMHRWVSKHKVWDNLPEPCY